MAALQKLGLAAQGDIPFIRQLLDKPIDTRRYLHESALHALAAIDRLSDTVSDEKLWQAFNARENTLMHRAGLLAQCVQRGKSQNGKGEAFFTDHLRDWLAQQLRKASFAYEFAFLQRHLVLLKVGDHLELTRVLTSLPEHRRAFATIPTITPQSPAVILLSIEATRNVGELEFLALRVALLELLGRCGPAASSEVDFLFAHYSWAYQNSPVADKECYAVACSLASVGGGKQRVDNWLARQILPGGKLRLLLQEPQKAKRGSFNYFFAIFIMLGSVAHFLASLLCASK